MASPAVTWSGCPSGELLAGGRFTFLPGVGEINNINRNTAWSVDPDAGVSQPNAWYNGYAGANSLNSLFTSWNGAVWCPEYSRLGAMAFYGGGHGANTGCFAAIFDFTTRLWSVVGAHNLTGDGAWLTDGSRDADWKDFTLGSSKVFGITHQYAAVSYIPPGVSGAGPRGSLLLPTVNDHAASFSAQRYAPHLLDLSTGVVSRASPATYGSASGSGNEMAVRDTVNNKTWIFTTSSSTVRYFDLAQAFPQAMQTHTLGYEAGNAWGAVTWCHEVSACFCREAEMILCVKGGGSAGSALEGMLIDVSSGWPVLVNITLPATTIRHGGFSAAVTWNPDQQKFYIYEGVGETRCKTLAPSSLNFRTCSWTWGEETFGGVDPATQRGTIAGALPDSSYAAWRRMEYNRALKCLVWTDGPSSSGVCVDGQSRTGLVQLWKCPGVTA